MIPMGDSSTGGVYYAAEFGLGGEQTTYDSETETYSSNKDWLARRLYDQGRLYPNWMNLFDAAGVNPEEKTIPVSKNTWKDWFWVAFFALVILYIFLNIGRV